jgi:hypothetical protein
MHESEEISAPDHRAAHAGGKGADTEYDVEPVTFRIPLSVARTTAPGKHAARIETTWRACSGSICLRPQTATLEVPLQATTAR